MNSPFERVNLPSAAPVRAKLLGIKLSCRHGFPAAAACLSSNPYIAQEVANRIPRAGNIASGRGDKEASAAASKAAPKAREAATLEEAEQIYKNFYKRNN